MIPDSALDSVRDQGSLFAFLRDQLRWPVDPEDTFTYDVPGLDEETATRVEVSRLVPFSGDDPFVLLLAEFRPDFRRGALRRVLQAIRAEMRKKAAYQGKGLEDLVFLCVPPDYGFVRFAHFREQEGRQPKLAVFGWERGRVGETRTLRDINLPALRLGQNLLDEPDWSRETVDRWRGAWDVEKVTNEFFRRYREVFNQVEESLQRAIPDAGRRRMYTQRLFNRLLFIAFIERKGWLRFEDRTDYLAALFEAAERDGESFLNDRLYWAFFAGLGTLVEEAEAHSIEELVQLRGEVPFLNGGLFEMEDELDTRGAVTLANDCFRPILRGPEALFNRFQFTVTESTPDDIDVAVDPEMLGKVFEELVTGRHETGSYYTPKPVVSFMCREALKCYLETALEVGGDQSAEREAIAAFVDEHQPEGLAKPEAVLEALRRVRACDPACGSGAYLLGMLHELLDLRACLFATRRLDQKSIYERKLEIIQNNLYGVDIDPFAVNIARLRLWLSLSVDYQGERPPPLPNLDFKVEVGDSLLGPAPSPAGTGDMFRQQLIEQFRDLKRQFLTAHGKDKSRLRKEIAQVRKELAEHEHRDGAGQGFDWQVEFAEVFFPEEPAYTIGGAFNFGYELTERPRPGGFDVVVANPPYVRHELLGREFKEQRLRPAHPEVYAGTADLYVYFYSRAHQILAPGGAACFISSNKWLSAAYGARLRQHLLDATEFRLVADFGDLPVFNATAYACVFAWRNMPRRRAPTSWAKVLDLDACFADGMTEYVSRVAVEVPAERFASGNGRLTGSTEAARIQKMAASGPILGELVGDRFVNGIKTGLNQAFVVDRATRDRLVASRPELDELIRPFLHGKDVARFVCHPRDEFVLNVQWHTDLSAWPEVLAHLLRFEQALRSRDGVRDGPCPWYALSRPRPEAQSAWSSRKIVYPDIAELPRFALDVGGHYCSNTLYALSPADLFLLGVLNTSHLRWYLAQISPQMRGGYLRFTRQYMERVPVPVATAADRADVESLVDLAILRNARRRDEVERLFVAMGTNVAASTSKNTLEEPWRLSPAEFRAQARRKRLAGDEALFREVHDQTAELTEQIEAIEAEIDDRVAALYGL